MKKQIIAVSVFFTLAFTYELSAQGLNDRPICGTDQVMSAMPNELKREIATSATAFQASELMLYLNFNGATVRPGFGNADTLTSSLVNGQRFCPPPSLTQAQKDEIVRLVADDFSPFNVRVTTDAAEFAAYPRLFKEMCLVTTNPSVIGQPSGVGGVSPFAGLGNRLPGDFAFAFSAAYGNDPTEVALVVSHESAHLLGLGHQHLFDASCNFITEYHPGFGTGPTAFDPIMGGGVHGGIGNWFAQSCFSPIYGLPVDDYQLINDQVTVRPDDFPDVPTGDAVTGNEINGVLERAGDVDYFKINFKGPGPIRVTSDNIDLKVSILNLGGETDGRVQRSGGH